MEATSAAGQTRDARLSAREAVWVAENERILATLESLNASTHEQLQRCAASQGRLQAAVEHATGLAQDVRVLFTEQEQQLAHQTMGWIYDWYASSGVREDIERLKATLQV